MPAALRWLRWALLLPLAVAAIWASVTAGIAAHYLLEQHACPAADLVAGICSNAALGRLLWWVKHGMVAIAAAAALGTALAVAPAHRRAVLAGTLALELAAVAWLVGAGQTGPLAVPAAVGALAAAAVAERRLRRRAAGQSVKA